MPTTAAAEKGGEKRFKSALATAVAHPLRTWILAILGARVASPTQIARQVKWPVNKVGYQVTALADAILIEEVANRPVRGAVEHFYKAIDLPFSTRSRKTNWIGRNAEPSPSRSCPSSRGDTIQALDEETLVARTDHHLTRITFNVDEAGWHEMTAAYMELYERVGEIQATSATPDGRGRR
jgi:hypothetical protein